MPVDLDVLFNNMTAYNTNRGGKIPEILDLLQEECGEVIVAVSKWRRFREEHNRDNLVQELGDVRLLIELLRAHCFVSEKELHDASAIKAQKLSQFSTVYEK